MNIIRMTLLTLLLLPLSGWSKDVNLFVIQRSKNTNEVQYQLHVNDRCQIVSDKPVGAFWHLREVSPEKTEPLTDLEHMAYGVANQKVAENRVSFDLGVLELAAHEAFDGVDRVLRVGDGLALGHLAYQPLAALRERYYRGRGAGDQEGGAPARGPPLRRPRHPGPDPGPTGGGPAAVGGTARRRQLAGAGGLPGREPPPPSRGPLRGCGVRPAAFWGRLRTHKCAFSLQVRQPGPPATAQRKAMA